MTFMSLASRWVWLLLPPSVLVLVGSLLFPSTGRDDTHITCWPAYTLSHFGQILNYNGERVEQSSSLLQVLLLAVLAKATAIDIVTLAKVSSIAFGVGTLLLLFALVDRVAGREAAFCAALIAGLSTPVVYWSFSGMETSLASCCGLLLLVSAADYLTGRSSGCLWKPALAGTAFATVRPETPFLSALVLACTIAFTFSKRSGASSSQAFFETVRRAFLLLIVLLAAWAALVTFRWMYFGALVPQPATAKFQGLSADALQNGVNYLVSHTWSLGRANMFVTIAIALGTVVSAVGQIRSATPDIYITLSLLFTAGYAGFVVVAGGDWMEGRRFLAHFWPVAIAMIPIALSRIMHRRWIVLVTTAFLVVLEGRSLLVFATQFSASAPLWSRITIGPPESDRQYSWFETHNRVNVRDMALLQQLDDSIERLLRGRETPIVLLSGQMGIVPYHLAQRYFGRIRFIDRFGLVERSLTNCALTRRAGTDTGGLIIDFDRYFQALGDLEQLCHIAKPDIVFLWGNAERAPTYGYQVTYRQKGSVEVLGSGLAGAPVIAKSFIAVRNDLIQSAGLTTSDTP